MTPRLLNVGRLPPALLVRLANNYEVMTLADQADPASHLAAHGSEYTAAVTSAPVGIDATLLQALPNLKVVSSFGVGLDKIDVAGARHERQHDHESDYIAARNVPTHPHWQ